LNNNTANGWFGETFAAAELTNLLSSTLIGRQVCATFGRWCAVQHQSKWAHCSHRMRCSISKFSTALTNTPGQWLPFAPDAAEVRNVPQNGHPMVNMQVVSLSE
jgi:hypothetical protein